MMVLSSPFKWVLALIGAVSIFFLWFPSVDIAVSRLFFLPQTNTFLGQDPFWLTVRDIGRWGNILLPSLVGGAALLSLFPLRFFRPLGTRLWGLLMVLALGPGLLVNGLFKSFWGRARPHQVLEFGGEKPFSPVWYMSDACHSNCSFISGEAAASAWICLCVWSLSVLLPPLFRSNVRFMAVTWMLTMSLLRVVAGGHFLSDVLLGMLSTFLLALWIHGVLHRRKLL